MRHALCCSVLLQPLQALDKARGQAHNPADAGGPRPPPDVLLLLDALDESDDGGRGWEPVTQLVGKE